jgi:phosphomannomutase
MADVLMLGVSGMRGIVGSTLTPDVVARFAGAIAGHLTGGSPASPPRRKPATKPVVILGADGRAGWTMPYHAATAGLLAAGCDVVHAGLVMTPTVGVLVDQLPAAAGIVLTASHNPQQWNGVKPILRDTKHKPAAPDASAPPKDTADAIIARYRSANENPATLFAPWNALGTLCPADPGIGSVHPTLVAALLKDLGILKTIKNAKLAVALDRVGPAGDLETHHLLESLGTRAVGPRPDLSAGLFPHTPEPTADNLKAFGPIIRKHKADVGFAQDPDCDRLALVDESGTYIGEEYTLALAARAMGELGLLNKRSTIAVNLSTSRMIDDVAARFGAKVLRTPVGEANVVAAMKQHDCALGGEGNGGVIWPEVTYIRDSLGAMALVLALMARTGMTLSALTRDTPSYAIIKRKVDLARQSDAKPAVDKLAKHYRHERVDTQDGVRIDFAARSAWVHVRASNTEPIMRLIAEAPTPAQATGLLDEVAAVIA